MSDAPVVVLGGGLSGMAAAYGLARAGWRDLTVVEHGAELGGGSERDMAWLSLRSLSDKAQLDPSFDLFVKVLSKPDFPAKDFRREQQLTLIGLEYQKQKPKSILEKSFYRSLYGDHPYASNPSGTEKSVAALKVKDLKAFYERYYVAKNATIVMVGDLDRADQNLGVSEGGTVFIVSRIEIGDRWDNLIPIHIMQLFRRSQQLLPKLGVGDVDQGHRSFADRPSV